MTWQRWLKAFTNMMTDISGYACLKNCYLFIKRVYNTSLYDLVLYVTTLYDPVSYITNLYDPVSYIYVYYIVTNLFPHCPFCNPTYWCQLSAHSLALLSILYTVLYIIMYFIPKTCADCTPVGCNTCMSGCLFVCYTLLLCKVLAFLQLLAPVYFTDIFCRHHILLIFPFYIHSYILAISWCHLYNHNPSNKTNVLDNSLSLLKPLFLFVLEGSSW